MCGIVGVGGGGASGDRAALHAVLDAAAATLIHRGPDGSGTWVASGAPIGFGHRRLSVIDLSEDAAQPMVRTDPAERAITFNGEIYNYAEIRQSLEADGVSFQSHSDTEVLLHSCRARGVRKTLEAVRGMFAFGYYDARSRTLWLARDRFGEKPLYYALWNGTMAFASELRALRSLPGFPTDIDTTAVEMLMRHSCIGGERTIYAAARKLLPGSALSVRIDDRVTAASIETVTYWSADEEAARAAERPFTGDIDEAADELDILLGSSVVASTVSDVPVGAFLSAGLDSTSVVSQLARRTSGATNTFTIGFGDEYRSEAPDARRIAGHLGTNHTELTVTADDALGVVDRIPHIYDEPFADSSQIPTVLVSELAKGSVTVALSGDGGDELFAGYPRYRRADRVWRMTQATPPLLRAGVARAFERMPESAWERTGSLMARTRLRGLSGGLDERASKATALLRSERPADVYRVFVTSFAERSPLSEPVPVPDVQLPPGSTTVERLMLRDTTTYLPDDLLTKVDRAAMSVSLETRIPILSPEVFAFAHRLPLDMKLSGSVEKRVLRHLLARHVPQDLWEGPKRGFSVPLGTWLRGPLEGWAQDLLSTEAIARRGILNPDVVASLWNEHRAGRRDWGSRLWNVLMFQSWLQVHA